MRSPLDEWALRALRRRMRIRIYADSFYELTAPTADSLEEFVNRIRAFATDLAGSAAAHKKGVLSFYATPLKVAGAPEIFNMSLRTQVVEFDDPRAQKVLDVLNSISGQEKLYQSVYEGGSEENDQASTTWALDSQAWTRRHREAVRNATVRIRRGEEAFSFIDGVKARMKARDHLQFSTCVSSCDFYSLQLTLLFKLTRHMNYVGIACVFGCTSLPEGFVFLLNFLQRVRENELMMLVNRITELASIGHRCTMLNLTVMWCMLCA